VRKGGGVEGDNKKPLSGEDLEVSVDFSVVALQMID
jgi:hypothetical protein